MTILYDLFDFKYDYLKFHTVYSDFYTIKPFLNLYKINFRRYKSILLYIA